MKPQRKCIGCMQSKDKEDLLRIVFIDEDLVIDYKQVLPGRGCYVCDNKDCIDRAVYRKAFGRALKKDISSEALGRCFNDR